MEEFFRNEVQLSIFKFGPANIQDLASHFLIIFSIGLILYFAIFIDEKSQPIINKADRGEETSSTTSSTITQEIVSETVSSTVPSSPPQQPKEDRTERSPKKAEEPKTPGRRKTQQVAVPSTAEQRRLSQRSRKTPEKYKP